MLNRTEPFIITKSRLLFVEGFDEERFFNHLFKESKIENIQIINCYGKQNIPNRIKILPVEANFEIVKTIGIVRDADNDPNGAFISIVNALKSSGLPIPKRQGSFTSGKPKTGIFIIPGVKREGIFEDLCLDSVATDPAFECIEDYFACLGKIENCLPSIPSKAKMQVYLASKEKSYLRLGEAAEKGIWNLKHAAFEEILEFIEKLQK